MLLIGSHVERTRPLDGAAARDADVIQVHLSAPQQWRAPSVHGDEADLAASEVPVFVHAPYLINPSSIRPEVRKKSAAALRDQLAAADQVGAVGLVVHGGHPTGAGTLDDAITGWLEVLDSARGFDCRILIENTAGGRAAPARHVAALEDLFAALRGDGHDPGFVLDTCHAHAAGEPLDGIAERFRSATGTIDLVHANDSSDEPGSGRDRHRNLGTGLIGVELIAEVVAAAGAPAVVETPGGPAAQAADIAALRTALT